VIRTGVLSVNLVSTDMLEHNRGYIMKINLEKNESIFCQIIANVSLLVELENNKFLGSNYYREMKWSCSESNKKNINTILDASGIGNPAMLQMFMYALLVVPKELLGKECCINVAFNNEAKKYVTYNTSTYCGEENINYYRHIRNSIAHSKCEYFTKDGEDYVTFKDDIPGGTPKQYCEIRMATKNVGKLMEFMLKELMELLNTKINNSLHENE
jgi:hypothetical protein